MLFAVMQASAANASSADDLAKKIQTAINKAQNSSMSGRNEDAFKMLIEIDNDIAALQKAAPDHDRLANLITKFTDVRKKVEQKLGKTVPATANYAMRESKLSASAASTSAAPAKASGEAKLPSDVRTALDNFEKYHKRMLNNPSNDLLDSMRQALDSAIESAARANISSHPKIDEAKGKLAEAEAMIKDKAQEAAKEQAQQASKKDGAAKDVQELHALYERLKQEVFPGAPGSSRYSMYDEDLSKAEELAKLVEKADGMVSEGKKSVAAFKKKYGNSQNEVDNNTGGQADYSEIKQMETIFERYEKTKSDTVASLMEDFDAQAKRLKGEGAELNSKKIEDKMSKCLSIAERISPSDKKVKEAKASSAGLMAKSKKEREGAIDARKWPGHGPNAPANKDDIAKAGMDYLSKNPVWLRDKGWEKLKAKIKAIAVAGPWNVHKTDAFKNPTQYVIAFDVALETDDPKDKEQGVLRLVRLHLYTAEAAGVKQSPPFTYGNTAYSQMMRASALK